MISGTHLIIFHSAKNSLRRVLSTKVEIYSKLGSSSVSMKILCYCCLTPILSFFCNVLFYTGCGTITVPKASPDVPPRALVWLDGQVALDRQDTDTLFLAFNYSDCMIVLFFRQTLPHPYP